MSPKSHSYRDREMSQAMSSLSFKSRGEENIKERMQALHLLQRKCVELGQGEVIRLNPAWILLLEQ